MIEKFISQLKKFDEAENFFGKEFLDNVSFGECADAYLAKAYDYAPIVLKKEYGFKSNYFMLIGYLTTMKTQHVNGPLTGNETWYYKDWLLYKKSYNIRKAWFYATIQDEDDADEVVDLLINALGLANYHAVTTRINVSYEDYHTHVENVMEYVGNTRAVRDLSMKYLDPKYGTQWQFHLWNMTPVSLTENYGFVFYLGNEMSQIDYCPYNYKAHEYYYKKLYTTLHENLEKDIPKNDGITQERKKQIWEEIREDVLKTSTYYYYEANLDDGDEDFDDYEVCDFQDDDDFGFGFDDEEED